MTVKIKRGKSALVIEGGAMRGVFADGVRISEIAPPPDIPTGRMRNDMKVLNAVYQSGREQGKRFIDTYGSRR
jgi:predicted patatin/cPLA2 family phospholipase